MVQRTSTEKLVKHFLSGKRGLPAHEDEISSGNQYINSRLLDVAVSCKNRSGEEMQQQAE